MTDIKKANVLMDKMGVDVKKFLLAILLCFAVNVQANDLNADITRTISGADTTSGGIVADTAVSDAMDIRGYRYLQFYSAIDTVNFGQMFNYTNDTFFVDVQTSADKITWDITEVDTFLTGGSSWSVVNLDADATVFGNWIRCRFIYLGDAIAADQPDSIGLKRAARAKLWVMPKGGSN